MRDYIEAIKQNIQIITQEDEAFIRQSSRSSRASPKVNHNKSQNDVNTSKLAPKKEETAKNDNLNPVPTHDGSKAVENAKNQLEPSKEKTNGKKTTSKALDNKKTDGKVENERKNKVKTEGSTANPTPQKSDERKKLQKTEEIKVQDLEESGIFVQSENSDSENSGSSENSQDSENSQESGQSDSENSESSQDSNGEESSSEENSERNSSEDSSSSQEISDESFDKKF